MLNHVLLTSQVASSLPFDYAQGAAPRNDNASFEKEERAGSLQNYHRLSIVHITVCSEPALSS